MLIEILCLLIVIRHMWQSLQREAVEKVIGNTGNRRNKLLFKEKIIGSVQ